MVQVPLGPREFQVLLDGQVPRVHKVEVEQLGGLVNLEEMETLVPLDLREILVGRDHWDQQVQQDPQVHRV